MVKRFFIIIMLIIQWTEYCQNPSKRMMLFIRQGITRQLRKHSMQISNVNAKAYTKYLLNWKYRIDEVHYHSFV
jgi:hypothetical protein